MTHNKGRIKGYIILIYDTLSYRLMKIYIICVIMYYLSCFLLYGDSVNNIV